MQAQDEEQLHEWKESTEGALMALSDTHINDLSDEDLALIFKNLPPYTRLRLSEVCLRWWAVSQHAWLDVTHLDLYSIPLESIGAIVRKCPNLTSIFGKGRRLVLDFLRNISPVSFKAMHLEDCTFISLDDLANRTALPLFRSECGQSMEELVLDQHNYGKECLLSKRYSQRLLPVSIKRLQLGGLIAHSASVVFHNCYLTELGKLRNLECLILHMPRNYRERFSPSFKNLLFAALTSLSNLRELFFPAFTFLESGIGQRYLLDSVSQLPKLEILFLPCVPFTVNYQFLRSLINHPALRVLVFPSEFGGLQIAPLLPSHNFRDRFPTGLAATKPLPLLHIFYGSSVIGDFLSHVDGPANGLEVHPITAPFPRYLENEEIGSIFEGSWIAKQIRDGAKRGFKFWNYDCDVILIGPILKLDVYPGCSCM